MVNVESRVEPMPVAAEVLEHAASETLELEAAVGDLTIVLSDDTQLQELNREYLGTDAATDVLSFPADETDPDTGRRYLGDVLISLPRADAQALAAAHSLEGELQLLVVHGVLHLLGHDHAEPKAKASMWAAQGEVLKRLGLASIGIRE